MTFNLFVLPFFLGLIFLVYTIWIKNRNWVRELDGEDRKKLREGFHSFRLVLALKEIFFESLLHRKMFRRNPLLGYMHMSFAFGWFLLILFGNMESRIYSGLWINPPYYPIFLKFFIHDKHVLPFEIFTVPGFFRFSMDLILIFIISGLVLAVIKRSRSSWFGVKRTTQLQFTDKVAMTTLWLIFPLRLLAESFTAGAYGYGGGFITQHLGNVLAFLWPLNDKDVAYAFWWLYSLSLGIFFITLPWSRYMHIPAELTLILFRNFGITSEKNASVMPEVEIMSCSRCGVCIDTCQMNTIAELHDTQSVYFLQSIRNNQVSEKVANSCLLCGRCEIACPVGVNTNFHRLSQRVTFNAKNTNDYNYLPTGLVPKADVVYFAGCMSHLTPSIPRAMVKILKESRSNYFFADQEKTICCGRPLMLAGKIDEAKELMTRNRKMILESGAGTIVTSCPICYRVFKEDYNIGIRVLHHTQFILEVIKKGKIPVQSYFRKAAYHDPCELSRGSDITREPRELLEKVADHVITEYEGVDSLCCGGSLGLLNTNHQERDTITKEALMPFLKVKPEIIVTACPLCKKTLQKHSPVKVLDIAELIVN